MSRTLARKIALFGALCGAIAVGFLCLTRPARAQESVRPKGPGTVHFQTKLGSFKLLSIADEPISGHLEMSCQGSLLVTGFDKPPKTTGTLKLEYSYPPLKKYAYHGRGTIVLDGTWRSLQWFGSDMTAVFHGRAKLRLVGEFDKNLDTGTYYFDDPKKFDYWLPNSVKEFPIPNFVTSKNAPAPRVRGPIVKGPGY